MKVQEWLDEKYPVEKRNEIKKLSISFEELEGSLRLDDFTNLEELNCSGNQLTSLEIDACSKLREIDCSDNQLTSLQLSNLIDLEEFDCSDNFLVDLNLTGLSPERLVKLNLKNNKLSERDLSQFSQFVNLRILFVGANDREKNNRFTGSLHFLKDLTALEHLNIAGTDVNSGWESLPTDKLESFDCRSIRSGTQVRKIYELFGKENDGRKTAQVLKFFQSQLAKEGIGVQTQLTGKEIERLQQESKDNLKSIDRLQSELRKEKDKVDDLKSKNTVLEDEIQIKNQELEVEKDERKRTEERYKKLNEVVVERVLLEREIEELETKKKELEKSLTEFKGQNKNQGADKEREINRQLSEIISRLIELNKLKKEKVNVEEEIRKEINALSGLKKVNEELQTLVNNLLGKIKNDDNKRILSFKRNQKPREEKNIKQKQLEKILEIADKMCELRYSISASLHEKSICKSDIENNAEKVKKDSPEVSEKVEELVQLIRLREKILREVRSRLGIQLNRKKKELVSKIKIELEEKRAELESLKKEFINKGKHGEDALKEALGDLRETQKEVIQKGANHYLENRLSKDKKELAKYFSKMTVEKICQKQEEVIKLETKITKIKEQNIKNILLIGEIRSGKSTLANVLVSQDGKFQEVFKEDSSTASVTRDIQFAEFETEDSKYQVIDVPGFGATDLKEEQIWERIAEVICSLEEKGLNQVFFVIGDSFDSKEIENYNLLKQNVFGEDINKITIVRTKFAEFEQLGKKDDDIQEMINSGGDLAKIIQTAQQNKRILYVDNVPQSNERRSKSREILLSHLNTNCQEVYYPQNLEEIIAKIEEVLVKKRKLEQKLANLNLLDSQQVERLKNEIQKESKNIQQYLKEINWNNVATATQTVAGVASVAIALVPLCRIM